MADSVPFHSIPFAPSSAYCDRTFPFPGYQDVFPPSLSVQHPDGSTTMVAGLRHGSQWIHGKATIPNSILVAISGICRHTNQPAFAAASFGVHFATGSIYNFARVIPGLADDQVAELEAAIYALRLVEDLIRTHGLEYELVVIKSNSLYLVLGMTKWIYTWQAWNDGYRTRSGMVENGPRFRTLLAVVEELERMGVKEVRFWHVRSEDNSEADTLANEGMNTVGVPLAGADF